MGRFIDTIAAPHRSALRLFTSRPGARTARHTHPRGQTIWVTEGVGLCQRKGGAYPHIDNTQAYGNEEGVGEAISFAREPFAPYDFSSAASLLRRVINRSLRPRQPGFELQNDDHRGPRRRHRSL